MIVLGNRRDFSEAFLGYLYPFSIGLFVVAAVSICFIFFSFRQRELESPPLTGILSLPKNSFEAIGQGVFNLQRQDVQQLPNLRDELILRALNTRPDAKQMEEESGQPRFLFGFRGNPVPVTAKSGQILYLSWEKAALAKKDWYGPPAPISISSTPTPWTIEPLVLENQVFIAAKTAKETDELLLKKSEGPNAIREKVQNTIWYQLLKTARFWTTDRFCSSYSQTTANSLKVGFGRLNSAKVLIIDPGQYLFFASGEWQQGNLEFAGGRPLAQVLSQTDSALTLQIWDESGFFLETISIPPLSPESYPFTKMDALFSALKARNNSEVSSVMGKRRVVLKPGDWWIKTERGWRRLKKRGEIEDYLSFRLLGELFVVDGLEMFQGKTVIKGQQFDPLRQRMQSFLLPIAEAPGRNSKPHSSGPAKDLPPREKKPHRPLSVLREHNKDSAS